MDGKTSVNPFPFDTYSTDDWSMCLGQRGYTEDGDNLSGTYTENSLNGRREMVLVYNGSGGTLACGNSLKFVASYYGTRVQKGTTGVSICGYVPPAINGSISNTIPDGAYFWMVKEGFTSVLKSTADVTEGTQIKNSATAGQVAVNSGTAIYDVVAGSFIAADAGGTSNLVRAYANCQW